MLRNQYFLSKLSDQRLFFLRSYPNGRTVIVKGLFINDVMLFKGGLDQGFRNASALSAALKAIFNSCSHFRLGGEASQPSSH